ncbi:alpha/beta hydrolase [Nostoc sp. MS1]|uniref:alpha/beta hydrolase n=1 Tax=Nostoc sp. MS1 TaxID=2764711 RepID=UPI001CC548BD|nr:alpha/beta hydrolase [Nostoc sp. MS1]BCL37597.1 hypothetical protein NSMS1_40440 [Nostoc sp. MS1]
MSTLDYLPSEQIYTLSSLKGLEDKPTTVPAYYLRSTATINVEDLYVGQTEDLNKLELKKIAQYLINIEQPELVLHIHGYANSERDAINRYQRTDNYINSTEANFKPNNYVFIGYRWPAENPMQDAPASANSKPISFVDKIVYSLQSLPNLPLAILITTLFFGLVGIILSLWTNAAANFLLTSLLIISFASVVGIGLTNIALATKFLPIIPNGLIMVVVGLAVGAIATLPPIAKNPNLLFVPITVISIFIVGIILALIALRLSAYPRDRFRASNYGVLDLVRFFQDLQKEILEECKTQNLQSVKWKLIEERESQSDKIRIKISFIAHSLGCEVATQTIRILSDVFDPDAIVDKPSPEIGDVFSLGRLVLVAPDIPLESILTSRANFLRPSLKRCEEAYVFCNEADLALRLASTAANYFSFPSRTRFRGYKLGNITVNRQAFKENLQLSNYGILNSENDNFTDPINPLECLEIRASSIERQMLNGQSFQAQDNGINIGDFFTYFDCTDYQEIPNQGLLSFAKGQPALNLLDYIQILLAYFFSFPKYINVHGGYFDGKFCENLINELAFLGYKGLLLRYLDSTSPHRDSTQFDRLSPDEKNNLFLKFSQDCQNKYIQVILASQDVPNAVSRRVHNS